MKVEIDEKEYVEKNYSDRNGNSGDCNSGKYNSGDWNSGNCNSRNYNSGDRNSGNGNSGGGNSGNYNSGNGNSGNWNSGNCNSGDWNSGDCNSGYFNTNKPRIRIFNKETDMKIEDIKFPNYFYFDLNIWVNVESMSDKEKEIYCWYKTTEGYLRTTDYKEAWKKSFNDSKDLEDIKKTLELPNFDYNIFEEITGISEKDFNVKLGKVKSKPKE